MLRRLFVRAAATVPVLACLVLLGTVTTGAVGTILVTAALLGYLVAWDRTETPAATWRAYVARLAVPVLIAGSSLVASVLVAVALSVRDPSAALFLALLGMAAAVAAVGLAVLPVIGRPDRS